MRILISVLAAVAATITTATIIFVGLPLFGGPIEPLVLKERWTLRWEALDVADQSLSLADEQGWIAMAGLNDAAIDAAFDGLHGASLTYSEDGPLEGTKITIEEIVVTPSLGAMDAAVALTAERDDLTLGMVLGGSVLVHAIENGSQEIEVDGELHRMPTSEIVLRIDPAIVDLSPGARGDLDRRQRGFWTDLAPGLADLLLPADLLTVRIPLQAEFRQNLGLDEEHSSDLDETSGASVTYRLSMPENDVSVAVAYGAPVYTDSAVWVMARVLDEPLPDIRPRTPPKGDAAAIERAARALDEAVKARLAPVQSLLDGATTPRLALVVDGALLSEVSERIMSLPDEGRRVTSRLVAASGRLAETEWRDDLLGGGGAFVEIACGTCASFAAQLHGVDFETFGETWRASVAISAEAQADLHGHFDPLVGGGNGTTVGVEGGTNGVQSVDIELEADVLEDETGFRLAALAVRPSCSRLDVIATTDGRLEFDLGWISMPKIGARLLVPVGADPVRPLTVLAAEPFYIDWSEPRSFQDVWTLELPMMASVVTMSPVEFSLSSEGMRAAANMDLRHIPLPEDPAARAAARAAVVAEVSLAAAEASEREARLLSRAQEECRCQDTSMGVRVLLGDIEIGPNNEIVKFFRNAWNDITNGPGPNNEIVKFLDGMGETFHQFDAVTSGLVKGILDESGRVLAYGEDAVAEFQRGLEGAGESLGQAVEEGGEIIAEAGEAIIDGAEDAVEVAEEVIEKPVEQLGGALEDGLRALPSW